MFETIRQRPKASVLTAWVCAMQGFSRRHVSNTGKHLNDNQMITNDDK
ncbi:hypothetical protein HMPREF0620_1475 [Parascardovia denticolens DSM 10105 = JCM 12538]|uniref:Uncharacterized protein n=1 Tax=Parascardovia denticolens DSM 10105 = JCM 12538 TaxID=864564 RepID=E6K202_PARDN|nr:hypothetical protein HMPREF0620_1475 [Parascardovia denticolens DSM 10105 = JCM 12538]BAR04722.1 hypothetical protein PSDT_0203 [Parascardovia denticolens DSM 10105 = JCM 12538]